MSRFSLTSRGFALFLVGASLVGVAVSVATQVEQYDSDVKRATYESCVDGVVNRLVENLNDTRAVASVERNTTRRLYEDIRDNPRDFRERIDAYLAELDEADAQRQANPLPPPPSVACQQQRAGEPAPART